jgi:DNA repair protein RecO (recombination protein O)
VNLISTAGLILRQHPIGETDRIVSIYGESTGKIRAVAKGAQSPRSRFAGILEPFNVINFILFKKGNQDLFRMNQAEAIRRFRKIGAALDRLGSAFEIIEILGKFTPDNESNPELYTLAEQTLARLDQQDHDPYWELRSFQFRFFGLSGYALELTQCVVCGRSRNNRPAYVSAVQGGAICQECKKPGIQCHLLSNQKLLLVDQMTESIVSVHPVNSDSIRLFRSLYRETKGLIRDMYLTHFSELPKSDGLIPAI